MIRMKPRDDKLKRFEVRIPSRLLEQLDEYLKNSFQDWERPSRNMFIVQSVAEKLAKETNKDENS